MKIRVDYTDEDLQAKTYAEASNMLDAMVKLRRCQLETGTTSMDIVLTDIQDGDV